MTRKLFIAAASAIILSAGLGAAPAQAHDRFGNFVAGAAAVIILNEALHNHHHHPQPGYVVVQPAPRAPTHWHGNSRHRHQHFRPHTHPYRPGPYWQR